MAAATATSTNPKIAVVTGANKGIGLGIVKSLLSSPEFDGFVYLTSRNVEKGQEAVGQLNKIGLFPKFHQLDITSAESIKNFHDYIQLNYDGIDVLVNNAAIAFKDDALEPFQVQAAETIKVNYFGTLNVCHELFPLLRKHARVVNMSSCVGHLSRINGAAPVCFELQAQLASEDLTELKLEQLMNNYVETAKSGTHNISGWPTHSNGVSKAGVTALTRIQQRRFDQSRPNDDILVNSVHPGYVATDLTNFKGHLSIEEGSVAATWLALLPPGSDVRGAYVWHDKQIVDWVHGTTPAKY